MSWKGGSGCNGVQIVRGASGLLQRGMAGCNEKKIAFCEAVTEGGAFFMSVFKTAVSCPKWLM